MGLGIMGDEGDREMHEHMPMTMLRCTWRPSQEVWRPKGTESLKQLGLMGYFYTYRPLWFGAPSGQT